MFRLLGVAAKREITGGGSDPNGGQLKAKKGGND